MGEKAEILTFSTNSGREQKGTFSGELVGTDLHVAENASVAGAIYADNIVVRGRVVGEIRGNRVELKSTAMVEGDIVHNKIFIESGAHFEGSVQRQDDPFESVSDHIKFLLGDARSRKEATGVDNIARTASESSSGADDSAKSISSTPPNLEDALSLTHSNHLMLIDQIREDYRKINSIDPQHREMVSEFLDQQEALLEELTEIGSLSDDTEAQKAAASWLERFSSSAKESAALLSSPEAIGSAVTPAIFLLSAGAIGAVVGSAFGVAAHGFTAAILLAGLTTGQVKGEKAAQQIVKNITDGG